jgi:hypothetical protein
MSLILTPDILNLLLLKHNNELNKIIGNDININLLPELKNINCLINQKKYKMNNETRCLAKNSQNNQCKRNRLPDKNYCKKHLLNNKGDYNENYTNIELNVIIECEYIMINDVKYIYNKNNNLLFSNDLYKPECVGIYINGNIFKYIN